MPVLSENNIMVVKKKRKLNSVSIYLHERIQEHHFERARKYNHENYYNRI